MQWCASGYFSEIYLQNYYSKYDVNIIYTLLCKQMTSIKKVSPSRRNNRVTRKNHVQKCLLVSFAHVIETVEIAPKFYLAKHV